MEQYYPNISCFSRNKFIKFSQTALTSAVFPSKKDKPSPDVNLWLERKVTQASYKVNKSKLGDSSPWVFGVSARLASKVLTNGPQF